MMVREQMEQMAAVAKNAAGWNEDGTHRPISEDVLEGADLDQAAEDRAYAEGVEAGILWALGYAGDPLPR